MNNSLKGLYCLDFGTVDAKDIMMGLKIFKAISKVWPKDLNKNSTTTLVHCLAQGLIQGVDGWVASHPP